MKKCTLRICCRDCPNRDSCPKSVRRSKKARRPMADSASRDLLNRAGILLSSGWYTCNKLGEALYGVHPTDKKGRMSIMVRARRPINRLRKLGVIAMRPDEHGVAEYTLLPGGMEVLR